MEDAYQACCDILTITLATGSQKWSSRCLRKENSNIYNSLVERFCQFSHLPARKSQRSYAKTIGLKLTQLWNVERAECNCSTFFFEFFIRLRFFLWYLHSSFIFDQEWGLKVMRGVDLYKEVRISCILAYKCYMMRAF